MSKGLPTDVRPGTRLAPRRGHVSRDATRCDSRFLTMTCPVVHLFLSSTCYVSEQVMWPTLSTALLRRSTDCTNVLRS
jgi:hypothetical protein